MAMNEAEAALVNFVYVATSDGSTAGFERSALKPLTSAGTIALAPDPAVERAADKRGADVDFAASEVMTA